MVLWEPIISEGKYTIEKVVGRGAYGQVVKAFDYERQKYVAIKRMAEFASMEYQTLKVVREIKLMKQLNQQPDANKYIPILYDVIVKENPDDEAALEVYLVMEYLKTDLKRFLETKINSLD